MTLPTFMLIGSGKSGSTSLYYYLSEHPKIYMSPVKEPRFFMLDDSGRIALKFASDVPYVSSLEAYEALYANSGAARAIGEASIQYLETPGTAERIAKAIPSVKLLAVLRNPVERVFSIYLMRIRDGQEKRPFEQFIADPQMREIVIDGGYYARHLRAYLRVFPRNQFLVFLYEDLRDRPAATMESIYRYLGVDDAFVPDLSLKANVSGTGVSRVANSLMQHIRGTRAKTILDRRLPVALRRGVVRGLQALAELDRGARPTMNSREREVIEGLYRNDVRDLEKIIGRDLSHWM